MPNGLLEGFKEKVLSVMFKFWRHFSNREEVFYRRNIESIIEDVSIIIEVVHEFVTVHIVGEVFFDYKSRFVEKLVRRIGIFDTS